MGTDVTRTEGMNDVFQKNPTNARIDNSQQQNVGQTNVVDITNILRNFKTTVSLSEPGRRYIDTLTELLQKNGIKLESLTTPMGAYVALKDTVAFVLMMSEVLAPTDTSPVVSYAKSTKETVRTCYQNVSIVNYIVVTPDDYGKVQVMANHIINNIIAFFSSDMHNVESSMFANYQIQTTSSPEAYSRIINAHNPHGVAARNDLKLVIYGVKKGYLNQKDRFWTEQEKDRLDIAAVAGYTIFVRDMNNKILPEIHISEITSPIPIRNLIPMILSIAVLSFMDQGLWKRPFFDLGQTAPNIGNLFIDQTTKGPYKAKSSVDVNEAINVGMNPPCIVLDLPAGRARVIGLEQYGRSETDKVLEDTGKFFKQDFKSLMTDANGHTISPYQISHYQYDGTFCQGGVNTDSRWIDYLNLMIHHSANSNKCGMLLQHFYNPVELINKIREFGIEITPLYHTIYSVLTPAFTRKIQEYSLKMNIDSSQLQSGFTNNQVLWNASQGYANSPLPVAAPTVGFDPFNRENMFTYR